jgi:autotransporter translocation and assembly factor TamB
MWSLAVDGSIANSTHHILFQTGQPGHLGFEDRTLPVKELSLDAMLRETALDIKSVKLVTGKSTIATSGVINNFDDPRFDIRADTNLNLGSLVQFAGVKQRVDGNVNVQVAANGPVAQLKVTANVSGSNLSVEGFERIALDANTNYDAAQARIRIGSLTLRSPEGNLQGNADIAITEKAGASELNAYIKSLDLANVSRTLKLPVRIASRADGKVKAHWKGLGYEKADGDASVRLTATRSTAAKDVIPVSGSLTATSRNQNVTLNIAGLNTLDTSANGRITLDARKRLGGELTGSTANLTALVAGMEGFLGKQPGTLAGTEVAGSANLKATLGGTLTQPQVTASLASPNLAVGQIHDVAVAAEATYNPNQLAIQSAEVRWHDQSLTASGTVGMKGRSQVLNLTASTQNVSIETVLAALDRKDIPAA